MAIFGCILTDNCVRIGDRVRILADRNSVTPDEDSISMVEVDPDGSGTFFDVSDDLFLDWEFANSGTQTISLRVTAGANQETFDREIEIKDPAEDCLFADDSDLMGFEPQVYDCLECHRCNFNHVHRQVSECIMECLNQEGLLWDGCGAVDISRYKGSTQLNKWATFWALELIFMAASKAPGDFWDIRSIHYRGMRTKAFGSYKIGFDKNGDGVIEQGESRIRCNRLVRK